MSNAYIQHERMNEYMDYVRTCLLSANGFALKATANADAKTTANSVCSFKNVFVTVGAQATVDLSTAVPTTGTKTISAGDYAVAYVFANAAGTVSIKLVHNSMEVPAFTAGSLCCIGALKIANGTTSDFVVGTTALDTAKVTTTYYTPMFLVPGDDLA